MASSSFLATGDVGRYLTRLSTQSEVARRLAEETDRLAEAGMRSSPEACRFLAMLVKLTGARRLLEVGTFTGYSALWLAEAMPDDGRLTCCDISEQFTAVGRPYWEEAGLASRIDLRLGDAVDTLAALQDAGDEFDFAFIDADKQGYPTYYQRVMRLLRPGGVMVFDNALRGGRVADESDQDPSSKATRAVVDAAYHDPRAEASLLLIGDGLLLVRKR